MSDVSKINGYNIKDNTARNDINKIITGANAASVAEAKHALNADNANIANYAATATNYDTVIGNIKSKFDEYTTKFSNIDNEIAELKKNNGGGSVQKYDHNVHFYRGDGRHGWVRIINTSPKQLNSFTLFRDAFYAAYAGRAVPCTYYDKESDEEFTMLHSMVLPSVSLGFFGAGYTITIDTYGVIFANYSTNFSLNLTLAEQFDDVVIEL